MNVENWFERHFMWFYFGIIGVVSSLALLALFVYG